MGSRVYGDIEANGTNAGSLEGKSDIEANGTNVTSPALPLANGTRVGDPALASQRDAIATALANIPARSLSRRKRRALNRYYDRQADILDEFEMMDALHRGHPPPEDVAGEALARRALNLSFASNVILLGVRLAIAIVSGSLSLIIATVDAVLDVLSSAMMYYASNASRKKNKYKYPVGRHRLEPLGVVIFSSVMATAAWTVIIEGIRQLAGRSGGESLSNTQLWVVVGGSIFVMFFKMGLFLYCRRSSNVAVAAFAQDHFNDVAMNAASLAGALLGAKVAWQIDPSLAIVLAVYIVFAWGRQGLRQVQSLVGVAAPPETLQSLTYLALKHRPDAVLEVDTVRAYTVGDNLVAEVDIVLPGTMPLQEAHGVGEELQVKLEALPGVARAFVHLDVESHHTPEHND